MGPEVNTTHLGDVVTVLRSWPDAFVQTVVTSPPYWGLRDYGVAGQLGLERTPRQYLTTMVSLFREVRRVLKDDGTLWLNLGDTYASSGGAGRQGKNGQRAGRTHTQINLRGTGTPDGLKAKDLTGIPWRVALALQDDGWYLRSDIIWSKPNPMPESVTDRPTKSHEYIFLLAKSERYFYDAKAIKEPSTSDPILPWADRKAEGELIRHGYSQNAPALNRKKKPSGWHDGGDSRSLVGRFTNGKHADQDERSGGRRIVENVAKARAGGAPHDNPFGTMRNKRSVWEIPTFAFSGAHFATFPEEIPTVCIKAGSRAGDIVLDPFMGSGTVAVVAKRLQRQFLGIELNPAYVAIAEKRVAAEPEPLLTE